MTRQLFDPDHNRLAMATELSADPPEYCPSCSAEVKYIATQGGTLRRLRCTCKNLEDMAKHSPNSNVRRLFS